MEDGHSVYRLYHEALAEHLRMPGQTSDKHKRIARALLASVPREGNDGPDWFRADPYIRSYLSLHAAEGGMLDELVVDIKFLLAADPAGLKLVLARCSSQEVRRWAAKYSVAAHDLTPDPGESAGYLELAAHRLRDAAAVRALAELRIARSWRTSAFRGSARSPHWTLEGHQNRVTSVAVAERHGRAVIVSGSWDKTVLVWDLETLELVGAPLEGHQNRVTSVAVGERQGRAVIVSGSWDKTVRVWDLVSSGSPSRSFNSVLRSAI